MLIKIFPIRKILTKKSQYIPIFDWSLEREPSMKYSILYYLDLIFVGFFVIIMGALSIVLAGGINIEIFLVIFILLYSLTTSMMILFSDLNNLEKFYINFSQRSFEEPMIFIRTKDRKVYWLFKIFGVIMWSTLIFWVLIALISYIIKFTP